MLSRGGEGGLRYVFLPLIHKGKGMFCGFEVTFHGAWEFLSKKLLTPLG